MTDVDAIIQAKQREENRLLATAGVTGVGVGFKQVNGEPTDEIAIRVYVETKLPHEHVPPEQVIPAEIDGYKTDVIQSRRPVHTTRMDARERPIASGIQIQRVAHMSYEYAWGTTGFYVQLEKQWCDPQGTCYTRPANYDATGVYLVTCSHVLWPFESAGHYVRMADDIVYQPYSTFGANSIGKAQGLSSPLNRYAGTVDVALAKLDQGTPYNNYAWRQGQITGRANASLGQSVRKHGIETGLTAGSVFDIQYSGTFPDTGVTLRDQLVITPDPQHSDGPNFGAKGDSGAAVVDDQLRVVGLLVGELPQGLGVVSKSEQVFGLLGIKFAPLDGPHTV